MPTKKLGKIKLVYILAASHSGSTLTAMLLGSHPQMTSVGELNVSRLGDPMKYLCSCRQKIVKCQFWQSVTDNMQQLGENFSILNAGTNIRANANAYESQLLSPLVRPRSIETIRDLALSLSPSWNNKLAIFQRKNQLLMQSVLERSNVETIIDSSKIGIRLKYLSQNPDLDIKVIWQVRDGRGVTLAYYNPSEYADSKDEKLRGGGIGKTQDVSREIAQGAHEWVRCNEEAINLLSTMDEGKWLKIHYEDICENTEQTIDEICEFLEVDKTKKNLDFRSSEHHLVGNGMRLDSSGEIKLDQRWQETFSVEQLQKFDRVAGEFNKRMGYS